MAWGSSSRDGAQRSARPEVERANSATGTGSARGTVGRYAVAVVIVGVPSPRTVRYASFTTRAPEVATIVAPPSSAAAASAAASSSPPSEQRTTAPRSLGVSGGSPVGATKTSASTSSQSLGVVA